MHPTRLLAALAVLAATVSAVPARADDVKLGSVAGATGPIAEIVAPILAARNLAAAHVNAQGGILGGNSLVLVLGDSQCDPKAAVDAAHKVVSLEQVVAVVGANCSGATNAMAQSVTIPAGIVSVSDASAAPSITALDDRDLVFRVAPSDTNKGAALARLAWDAGHRSLAVAHANDDYNSGIAEVFAATFVELGGTVTASEPHEPGKQSYRSEVAALAGAGEADALALFAYYGGSGISFLRNVLEADAFDTFLAADGMLDPSVIETLGAEALAGRLTIIQSDSDPENASLAAFAELYRAATDLDPNGPYVAHGYDATFLLALAIEKAGAADPSLISAALREIANAPGEVICPGEWEKAVALIAAGEDINYEGASGPVDFDAAGDIEGFYSINVVTPEGTFEKRPLK